MTTTKRKGLVSIGLPVYNGAEHLRESLDALLSQSYRSLELIISDNASTDDTPDICREYAGRDNRVRYYRNDTNRGSIFNFNRVVALADGEYFMWAADHDNWGQDYLSRCVQVLDSDTTVVLCSSEAAWIDSSGEVIEAIATRLDTRGLDKSSRFQVFLWSLDNCYPIYGVLRTAALDQIGPLKQSFAPDILVLTELSLLGAFACVPERLFYLRRTKGWGDAYLQAEKLNINIASNRSGLRVFWKLVWQRCQCATKHFQGLVGKSVAVLSIFLCMMVKYRWIIGAFQSSDNTRRAE